MTTTPTTKKLTMLPTPNASAPATPAPPANDAPAPHTPAPDAAPRPARPRVLIMAVVGLAAAICLMVLAFAAPAVNSGAHDLPLAVSGSQTSVAQLTTTLEQSNPGAFDVTPYASAADVGDAIESRDAIGGISFDAGDPDKVLVDVASAAGTPYAPLLRTVGAGLAAGGASVSYDDVVPLTEADPMGSALAVLALPLMFGGMASATVLVAVARRSRVRRVAGSIAFSVLAGVATTAVLQLWLGAVDGSFWLTTAGVTLGIAAISLVVLGLESLFGYAGLALGAVTMLFVSNPLSGIATGSAWLPEPWGAIGQALPIGAAGTVIRSAAFFDGAGSGSSAVVLGVWIVVGLGLVGLSARRAARRASRAAAEVAPGLAQVA